MCDELIVVLFWLEQNNSYRTFMRILLPVLFPVFVSSSMYQVKVNQHLVCVNVLHKCVSVYQMDIVQSGVNVHSICSNLILYYNYSRYYNRKISLSLWSLSAVLEGVQIWKAQCKENKMASRLFLSLFIAQCSTANQTQLLIQAGLCVLK